jgi:hypothetical protein
MVRVKLPAGVLLAVVIVSVELLPALTDVGLNVPLAPVGKPVTLKPTEPVKPLTAVVFTVYVVVPATVTVCELGLADSVKSGLAAVKGTIWMPFTDARGPFVVAPGVAVSVKPLTLGIVNTT